VQLSQARTALDVERLALGRTMVWAADQKQSALRLRGALDAVANLPAVPDPAEPIRAESQIVSNTEKLSRAEIRAGVFNSAAEGTARSDLWTIRIWVDLMTSPWELARAGRAFRLLYAHKIEAAGVDPGKTYPRVRWRTGDLANVAPSKSAPEELLDPARAQELEETTPLVQAVLAQLDLYLEHQDENLVFRRAASQVLALRIWQLEHAGRLPTSLDALLTSGLLKALPADPYRPEHHFGYVRSHGQPLLPLGTVDAYPGQVNQQDRLQSTTGNWLLYSVGPDRQDDDARNPWTFRDRGDLIFPLADSEK
jgi:hypothetical protein